ncbi:hypothetical protein J3R83DRAFT_2490 [Lanmaoa asiatica]|nr:hypothetical protein J3R83DRAFT_2490 [Lanmaoa asiatica]
MDHEHDVLGGYIPSFVQHLKDTGARLGLQVGSQVNEDQTSAGGAAEAHGLSSWTPAEHDAFFRAISLSASRRGPKWEVWMYLEALEEGAATLAMQQGGEDVDMQVDRSSSDTSSHSDSDTDGEEDLYEPALEVSQAWIDAEERMASWIVHEEHLASVGGDAAADTEVADDEAPKRKRGRPRGTGKGRAQGWVRGQRISNEGCHSPPSVHRSPSPEPTSMFARKREALMDRLEVPHLLVLDSILRESEETMKGKSKSREGSVTTATPTEHGDEKVPRVHDAEASSLSQRITAPQGTTNVSPNVVIDPVLLALSGGADLVGGVPRESTSTSCAPTKLRSVESDLSLFSPRSRRRIQKRLYMRRKRALLRENGAASEGVVHTGIEKLRPGKKANSERSEASNVSTPVPCSEATSDAEMKPSENVVKKNKPGLTLPYKLKAQFTESGIDAAFLRGQGMDLLNLGALGRLMGWVCDFLVL